MLSYSSRSGRTWGCNLRAARLVGEVGSSSLPAPIGDVQFEVVDDPKRLGLAERHPIQDRYPEIKVVHYGMIIEERFMVERNGVRGIALYADFNGSQLCASITSENGRNPLAPVNWEGKAGTESDPAALPYMEWRKVHAGNGKVINWCNAAIHGWQGTDGNDRGLDWRDGIPERIETMYDRKTGRVAQSIMVPVGARGLGIAEQTLSPNEVNDAYSVLLSFPRKEFAALVGKLGNLWSSYGGFRGGDTLEMLGAAPATFGGGDLLGPVMRGGPARSFSAPIQEEFKSTIGGFIKQHIIENPFGQSFWDDPEVLLVCHPIGVEQAKQLFSASAVSGRKTF